MGPGGQRPVTDSSPWTLVKHVILKTPPYDAIVADLLCRDVPQVLRNAGYKEKILGFAYLVVDFPGVDGMIVFRPESMYHTKRSLDRLIDNK